MADVLTNESLSELTSVRTTPCLSLYQPTHRHRPDNQQDPIRFRNLVKVLEASLRDEQPAHELRALLEPFEALARDHQFWNHTLDGLAVLSAPGFLRVFRLQRTVPELAVVAGSFHAKPLRRLLQSADRYQVLDLSRGKIRLFEGNRDTLDQIDPADGVPTTMTEALGDQLTDPHQTVSSYGGVGGAKAPMHHGHGGRKDEVDLDAERFFRAVDRAVLEHHSRLSGLPLVLASLPEHHPVFRKVSKNPFLLEVGLAINPEALTVDELRQRVWEIVEPQQRARQAAAVAAFSAAEASGLGSADLTQVAAAAVVGRVATLLVEAERQIAGHIDRATGQIQAADLAHPQVDDLLDDIGELVETQGGEVRVLPAAQMPTRTGLAAVYRH
jgi:hypothetical protein